MEQAKLHILVVDDEPNVRRSLTLCLEADGHSVQSVSNINDAIAVARGTSLDLAFVDVRLGTTNGIELISELLADSPWIKIVMITAFATIETAVDAIKRGALDFLAKPFLPAQIRSIVARVIELKTMQARIQELSEAVAAQGEIDVTSRTPAVHRAYEMAQKVAASDASILLRGESGTGKTVLARLIHSWSARKNRPFSTVSCPSLSPELLESELFGHVRGAFTGAMRDHAGRIAAAEGGTLFLDEIGDLPLALQPKLLRFLQEREYERVGDTHTRRADVRIIAATNVDLEVAAKEGRFRQDLFYRLNVIQIAMPPLRDRPEDIVPQAERILMAIAGKRIKGFSQEAIALLRDHAWPGNLRELRNAVERAAILSSGEMIEADVLPIHPRNEIRAPNVGDRVTLDELEERHIRAVLRSSKTLEEAAEVLGIDTATLWRRRKHYNI